MSTSALPPGPRSPAAVQLLNWLFRPIEFLESCRDRYGGAFSVSFPGFETPMVLISSPDAVAELFKEPAHGLPPGRSLALEPILGPRSILLLEGQRHLDRRRLMLPPFHGERMRAYEGTIAEIAEREIDRWPLDQPFAIHPRMQAVTLEVIMRAVFGVSDERRSAQLRPLLAGLLDRTAGPGLQLRVVAAQRIGVLPDPLAELRRSLAAIDSLLAEEVAERRAAADLGRRDDILSMLVAARSEGGEAIPDDELRDQLMTLLVAGHETTATALAWTFDLLLRHPDELARLRAELRDGSEELLRATISESLRLRPVVPLAGRRLRRTMHLDGFELGPGTDVSAAIWLTHTDPRVYPDPRRFRPERFLESAPETYGWIPFGGGIRRCLGASFAEFEMRVVLRAVLSRCELAGTRSKPERIARRNVTFSPRDGTPVRLRSRAPRPEPAPVPAQA